VRKDKNYFYYPIVDYQEDRLLTTKRMKRENAISLAKEVFDTHSMVTPLEYPANKAEFDSILVELKKTNDLYYETLEKLKMVRELKQAI
ncbi:hypothetical protein ACQVOA_28890, partial [Bacillus cereus]